MKEITITIPKNPEFGISKEQARRFIEQEHLKDYDNIIFDFKERDDIGEPFINELLKAYSSRRPEVELSVIGANEKIVGVITGMGKEVKIHKGGRWCNI